LKFLTEQRMQMLPRPCRVGS